MKAAAAGARKVVVFIAASMAFLGYVSGLAKRTGVIGGVRRRQGGAQRQNTAVPPHNLTVGPSARGGQEGMGRGAA